MPISFRGRIVQYAGRLHRLHEGKRDVEVHDYVDSYCAMTLKMYRNRLRAYRDMGYAIEEPAGMVGSGRPKRRPECDENQGQPPITERCQGAANE